MPIAPFAAGGAIALLGLRLVLAAISHVSYKRRQHKRTLVVLGSGGHTAEMMALLQGVDLDVYQPRCYVVAATDGMSSQKAASFEAAAAAVPPDEEAPLSNTNSIYSTPRKSSPHKSGLGTAQSAAVRRSPRVAAANRSKQVAAAAGRRALPGTRSPDSPAKRRFTQRPPPRDQPQQPQQAQQQYSLAVIPRSREVGQSFLSSVPTTLRALLAAVGVVLDHRPDVVLLNGPGTCIPIAAAALLLRLLGVCRGRVVYVESIARVYRLSLSGKILYHSRLAHTVFVQWEELQERYPRAVYAGRLM